MPSSRVEAEGASIDEAIERALAALGVAREQARVEILQDARKGLLGIGAQKAKVRVEVRRPVSAGEAAEAGAAPAPSAAAAAGIGASTPPASRASEPPRATLERPSRPVEAPPSRPAAAWAGEAPTAAAGGATPGSGAALAAAAAAILRRILDGMELPATVEDGEPQADGQPTLRVVTEHGGLLIGRHGQTLDALEYLVNRMLGRNDDRAGRVVIDCEGYRERHQRELREAAGRLAEKVRSGGRPQTMTPMSPRDRRIVHLALAGQPDIVTRSVGQGYLRRVVIVPARGARAASPPRDGS